MWTGVSTIDSFVVLEGTVCKCRVRRTGTVDAGSETWNIVVPPGLFRVTYRIPAAHAAVGAVCLVVYESAVGEGSVAANIYARAKCAARPRGGLIGVLAE
ncbi:hypothetical protein ES703_64247 [subsurface metagenome]